MDFPKLEKKILKLWKENNTFKKSIEQRKDADDFVFYEGPPTANAKPGIHHVLSRVFKDIICRYKTMAGFKVERKAGWDTHGLPVELEIEKKLNFKDKKSIEDYGVGKFNKKCKSSVWDYKKDWEELTKRIGFWLDLDDPYITYEPDYIETVWFILKQIWEKGLLYQDFKVVPYCPRCGTDLSSHELAQGYKKISEPAIYVKFKVKNKKESRITPDPTQEAGPGNQESRTYLLIWTTTPWTLPGNVAVAVNPKIDYVKAKVNNEFLILAKSRLEELDLEAEIEEEFKGQELLNLEYEGPYSKFVEPEKHYYRVVGGDFVSLEEGTGLVHMAPAFGEDDMKLSKEKDLPLVLNVDQEGKFKKEVKPWAGKLVTDKKVNKEIVKDLEQRGLLFKKENYEHDYPFCWRCDTKLIYYAKKSWFIKMSAFKGKLLKNNEEINWIPSHIKEGRFGEWLKEVKDWALSRERYWGTPLPVWRCNKCKQEKVIGSLKELLDQEFSSNNYFLLRHGETSHQAEKKDLIYSKGKGPSLTKKGREQIKKAAKELKKVDLIYSSDLTRAKETAQIVAKELGLKINFDKRLRDINLGIWHGKSKKEFCKKFPISKESFSKKPKQGESWNEVKKRMFSFIKKIDKKHNNKNILIVSHGDPIWLLEGIMSGFKNEDFVKEGKKQNSPKVGELRKVDFKEVPLNEKGELDFHRPYIDKVEFKCPKCSSLMKRVSQVIDCWFDSGSMPFAQRHWPFNEISNDKLKMTNKKKSQKSGPQIPEESEGGGGRLKQTPLESAPRLFPANYITEAIDQTRGWFYTLLAISTLLGFGPPYKNVICLGHVLDKKGEKMSKSKGNTVDPWKLLKEKGADALRWYFYTVNQPGDSKLFSEEDVDEALKKFIMTFWNSYKFFETYVPKKDLRFLSHRQAGKNQDSRITNILDRWILSKLNLLIKKVTNHLENYNVTKAARLIESFVIDDLSLWYIRRSRKRFHQEKDKEAFSTLKFVLETLSKLTAPFVPFLSEEIYSNFNKESVHLADWPQENKKAIDEKLNREMEKVRKVVKLALKIRSQKGIKVRQPLSKLQIKNDKLEIKKELLGLIKEELNVKEVKLVDKLSESKNWIKEGEEIKIALNVKITPKLKEEGQVREVIRRVQFMRKKAGYKPEHKILIRYSGDKELEKVLKENKEVVLKKTRAESFKKREKEEKFDLEKEVKINGYKLWLAIKKVNWSSPT